MKNVTPIVCVIVIVSGVLLYGSFKLYNRAASLGFKSKYLYIPVTKEAQRSPTPLALPPLSSDYVAEEIHFSNFEINFPLHKGGFITIPNIEIRDNETHLGALIADLHKREKVSFLVGKETPLTVDTGTDKLINLPLFKNFILRKSKEQIWRDIVSLDCLHRSSITEIAKRVTSAGLSMRRFMYEVFILRMRLKVFGDDFVSISHSISEGDDRLMGVVKYPAEGNSLKEKIYIFNDGNVYSLALASKINDSESQEVRIGIISKLAYRKSEPESSKAVYYNHRGLRYRDKINFSGILYLYSAWSHDSKNEEFTRGMISFFERDYGKNVLVLRTLYDYSFNVFGSTLSTLNKEYRETSSYRAKRSKQKKSVRPAEGVNVTKEVKENYPNRLEEEFKGEFKNDEEKIDYYLKRAKEMGNSP